MTGLSIRCPRQWNHGHIRWDQMVEQSIRAYRAFFRRTGFHFHLRLFPCTHIRAEAIAPETQQSLDERRTMTTLYDLLERFR